MTNHGHKSEQHPQGDPRINQYAGADGRIRQQSMGGAGASQPQPVQGQPYGYGQGYAPGYQPAQPYNPYGQAPQPGVAGMAGQPAYPHPLYVQPTTSQPVQMKKKRGKGFWIAIIVAVLCLVAAVAIAVLLLGGQPSSSRAGTRGQLEGKTPEEIQAELDRVVEEGMFNISIASVVEFEKGTSEGELRIENVPGNQYLMRVNITRDDTGETIYTSDMIEPDYHIQKDALDVDLPAGTYPCTASFTAYDTETEDEVGQAAAKITIQVKS